MNKKGLFEGVRPLLNVLPVAAALLLSGCGKEAEVAVEEELEPATAQSLLLTLKSLPYRDITASIIMKADINNEFFGEGKSDVTAEYTIIRDNDAAHIAGTMTGTVFEMEDENPTDAYTDRTGTWEYNGENYDFYEGEVVDYSIAFTELPEFDTVVMDETDDEYVLTGTKTVSFASGTEGLMYRIVANMTGVEDPEDLAFDVVVTFNKSDRSLKEMTLTLPDSEKEKESVTYEEFTIDLVFNEVSDASAAVPDEVKDAATIVDREHDNIEDIIDIDADSEIDGITISVEEGDPDITITSGDTTEADEVMSGQNFGKTALDIDYVTEEDLCEILGAYDPDEDYELVHQMCFILNWYTESGAYDTFCRFWDTENDVEKQAVAILCKAGLMDEETAVAKGANEKELKGLMQ